MDFSELKKFPWNEEIRLARQGDTAAVLRTCAGAEPIVDRFGKVSYFTDWLGKDEVRSIASLALVEFIMSYPGGVPDEEVPALIKQVIKCDLINSVHRAEYRRSREEPLKAEREAAASRDTEGDGTVFPLAPPEGEPEACLLKNAGAQTVRDAVRRLSRSEQAVIWSYYFRRDTTGEIAAALGCSPQNVRKTKRRALRRLRGLLDRKTV